MMLSPPGAITAAAMASPRMMGEATLAAGGLAGSPIPRGYKAYYGAQGGAAPLKVGTALERAMEQTPNYQDPDSPTFVARQAMRALQLAILAGGAGMKIGREAFGAADWATSQVLDREMLAQRREDARMSALAAELANQ